MKKLSVIVYTLLLMGINPVQADTVPSTSKADKGTQNVRVELNRLERQSSGMVVDMNVDLTEVHLIPDCYVYLYPWIRTATDSLLLPPILINGPQSDLMYRRRKALGKLEGELPQMILRSIDNELPRVNYRKVDIPYSQWMDKATLVLRPEYCSCDTRLVPLSVSVENMLPTIVERIDTIIIHDTIKVDRPVVVAAPVVMEKKKEKEVVTEHAGYRANIYFPVSGMKILPEHDLNRDSWHTFVSEIDSLRSNDSNTVMGITVTGYSSPEGNYNSNDVVAKRRALALKSYLETIYDSTLIEIRTEWVAEDWDTLVAMIKASDMKDKDKVLSIIDKVDIFKGREEKLKALSGGVPWKYISKEFFPKLRYASCRIGYVKRTEK